MNPEAAAVLEEILKIDPQSLTEEQKAFLRARSSYLKKAQAEEYKDVLEVKVEKEVKAKEEKKPKAKEEKKPKAKEEKKPKAK